MSLAEYIKNDLIASFRTGQISQNQLKLGDLSVRYHVSATPVRAAVKQLIDEGYLEQQSNRRLTIRKDHGGRIDDAVSPAEPPKDWYRIIANDLVRLSLQGQSVLVREESTAEKYQISRSSIRRIFNRLAGDGVLEHIPRCGWRLRPLQPADFDDYTDIRVFMELKALNQAWSRLVDEDLQAMVRGNYVPEDPDAPVVIDNTLHDYFITKAQNRYISDFFARHRKYYDVLFHWIGLDRDLLIQVVHDHQEILNAVLRRDRTSAERALEKHICASQPFLRQRMQDEFPNKAIGASDA